MMLSILSARLVAFFLHLLGKGATTLPGRVALMIKYNILTKLSKNVRIICVTGTNGKTTTCALLEHALKKGGYSYFINKSGANMLSGVTTAFVMNSTIFGRCKKEFAILECDENSLPLISRYVDAEIIAVTNLFRDQLDRYGEIDTVLKKIKEGIKNCPGASLVLNADDPLSYSLSAESKNKFFTFGINAELGGGDNSDMRYCPFCKTQLCYNSRTFAQLGDFFCPKCGYKRCEPDTVISDIFNRSFLLNGRLFATSLDGVYNLYNFCAAAAILNTLSIGNTENLCSFSGAFGRMEKFDCDGRCVLLLLVKNPVGLTGCINYVCSIKVELNIAFALNDNEADGTDVSWIWDSDFSPVKSKCARVFTLGTRSLDMAVRLKYDGISTSEIIDGEEYRRLLDIIKKSSGDFVIFSTYTSMMKLRKLLIDSFGGKDFWE